MKNGLKTTEFWVAAFLVLLPVINQYFDTKVPTESFVGAITYIVSRTILKVLGK